MSLETEVKRRRTTIAAGSLCSSNRTNYDIISSKRTSQKIYRNLESRGFYTPHNGYDASKYYDVSPNKQ